MELQVRRGSVAAGSSPGRRGFPVHHDARKRDLVESADRALMASEFRFLADDGYDVALCPGPGRDPSRCPLLSGGWCELVAEADVVLHALDPALGIPAAIKRARPALPVLVERQRAPDAASTTPDGCTVLEMPCSLDGQLEAIRRALAHG